MEHSSHTRRGRRSHDATDAVGGQADDARGGKSPWRQVRPWFIVALVLLLTGIAILTTAVIALGDRQNDWTTVLTPLGVMMLCVSAVPFILGVVRVLAPPVRPNERCGCCKFYNPSSTATYARGLCMVEQHPHATTSQDCCPRFAYSERAMARERLSASPNVPRTPREP
jgi:hypothetical protein